MPKDHSTIQLPWTAHKGTATKKPAATEKDTMPSSTMRKSNARRAVLPPLIKNSNLAYYQHYYRLMIKSMHFR